MVLDLIIQIDRNKLDGVTLLSGKESGLRHLRYHEVSAGERFVRIEDRIVSCRLVDHTDQSCCFLYSKFHWCLVEESLCGSLDAVCTAAEEHLVHIHCDDLVLGVVSLELHSCDPLLELDPYHLDHGTSRNPAAYILTRIESLCKLLSDGTSSSLTGISSEKGLEHHAGKTLEIDSGVAMETDVLSSYCSIDEIRRKFIELHIRPVLDVKGRKYLSVFSNDLSSQLAVRVLKFLERRDVGKGPYKTDQKQDHCYRYAEKDPEPSGYFLSCLFCHLILYICLSKKSQSACKKMSPLGDPLTEAGTKGQN